MRAEDGRAVSGCDISPFIAELPGGKDTTAFSTEDASGSTSQAAAIIESLEAGCRALLIDEDTSATNFMIRDVTEIYRTRIEYRAIPYLTRRVADARAAPPLAAHRDVRLGTPPC